MVRFRYIVILGLFLSLNFYKAHSQSLPVGSAGIEEYLRRSQLLGQLDSTVSFNIRPLVPLAIDSNFASSSYDLFMRSGIYYGFSKNKKGIQLLPVSLTQRYHTHPAYSMNDGPMIPGKGYQGLLSAGLYAKMGPLSIQIKPEYVFAGNSDFKGVQSHYGRADLPFRFGNDPYSKLFWGQSNIRLSFDPVSVGLSNENLWWGPGIRNSLLMSNTAPGFKHLTINTTRPLSTPVGSIEAQLIAGRLEGSDYTEVYVSDDWRYISGLAFSFQPRWFPGLFFGLTRSFQNYKKNVKSFGDYFPMFRPFQKENDKNQDIQGLDGLDQLTSGFARYVLPNSKAELYFEYGKNDHAFNVRDFLMAPDHSRTFTIGFMKLIPYKIHEEEYIQIGVEITRLEQSMDRIVRDAGEWYTHSPIFHGYTNRGEVLGAGIGPGGNFQSLQISWVKSLKQIGVQFERYEHNGDLTNLYGLGQWIDFSAAAVSTWDHKNFLLNAKLQAIQSVNYQWMSGPYGSPNKNAFNVNAEIGVMYRF